MSRPELTGHASLFYNAKEARKYDSSSRMMGVQREITERAIELLRLPKDRPSFVLDVGCGSGLSGQVLESQGHVWVGCDVSKDMLEVANERIERKLMDSKKEASSMDTSEDTNDEDEDEHPNRRTSPSTGDLMHHVRCQRLGFTIDASQLIVFLSRTWGQGFRFVQPHSMPAFRYQQFSGYAIPMPRTRFLSDD